MARPLEIYREYQKRLRARDFDRLSEVVDLEGYTETCLGLTPRWTVGFEVAWRNYQKNILAAFSDIQINDEEVIEGQDAVTIRSRIEATHTGEFLGIPATNRRITWDAVAIIHTTNDRFVGQWAQPDLWGIYQQIT